MSIKRTLRWWFRHVLHRENSKAISSGSSYFSWFNNQYLFRQFGVSFWHMYIRVSSTIPTGWKRYHFHFRWNTLKITQKRNRKVFCKWISIWALSDWKAALWWLCEDDQSKFYHPSYKACIVIHELYLLFVLFY